MRCPTCGKGTRGTHRLAEIPHKRTGKLRWAILCEPCYRARLRHWPPPSVYPEEKQA